MPIDKVINALEEYFELKQQSNDQIIVRKAREQAGYLLNDYIQKRFDAAMLEERRRAMSVTKKVAVVNPEQVKVTWEEVAKLLDALNSVPLPLQEPKQMESKNFVRWMEIYTNWYRKKRVEAMQLDAATKLELELEDEDKKR